MTPFSLDLLLFYKTRYWKYSLRKRPVQFVLGKGMQLLLALFLLAQLTGYFFISTADLLPFRRLPLEPLFLAAIVLSLAGLLYFPADCHRDVKKGVYYVFPVSGYTLNNMRIFEGLSSILFLCSCNLLVLPMISRSPVYGLFLPVVALLLFLVSLLIYDVIMIVFGKLWLLIPVLILILLTFFVPHAEYLRLAGMLRKAIPGRQIILIPVVLLLSAVTYILDTRLLITTTIKRIPNE